MSAPPALVISLCDCCLVWYSRRSKSKGCFSPARDTERTENETAHGAEAARSHQRDWDKCVSPVAQGKDSSGWQGAKGQRKLKAWWERPSEAARWRGGRANGHQPITTKTSKALAVHTEFSNLLQNERPAQCVPSDRCRWYMWASSGPWPVLSQACTWRATL